MYSRLPSSTFKLLKSQEHWWYFHSAHMGDNSKVHDIEHPLGDFIDALKEEYYPIGNYDD